VKRRTFSVLHLVPVDRQSLPRLFERGLSDETEGTSAQVQLRTRRRGREADVVNAMVLTGAPRNGCSSRQTSVSERFSERPLANFALLASSILLPSSQS